MLAVGLLLGLTAAASAAQSGPQVAQATQARQAPQVRSVSAAPAGTEPDACDYTVKYNNINIRLSPKGADSGYVLEEGYYWFSDPLTWAVNGQTWIYGENTDIHGWVGADYLSYTSGPSDPCAAITNP
jgi:hypothetical protein